MSRSRAAKKDRRGVQTLPTLVREYRETHALRLERLLTFYRDQGSLEAALTAAGLALDYDGRTHPHQYLVPPTSRKLAAHVFLRHRKKISTCESFDDLKTVVREITADIPRFGELATYDATLRIGSYVGVYPRRVYLHAGAKKGASHVLKDCNTPVVRPDQFPPPIDTLRPWEIEDFLCINEDKLKAQ